MGELRFDIRLHSDELSIGSPVTKLSRTTKWMSYGVLVPSFFPASISQKANASGNIICKFFDFDNMKVNRRVASA